MDLGAPHLHPSWDSGVATPKSHCREAARSYQPTCLQASRSNDCEAFKRSGGVKIIFAEMIAFMMSTRP
eukprot:10800061-Alexandrium_andersonii.AAC.1